MKGVYFCRSPDSLMAFFPSSFFGKPIRSLPIGRIAGDTWKK
jgi:hypothetical protein